MNNLETDTRIAIDYITTCTDQLGLETHVYYLAPSAGGSGYAFSIQISANAKTKIVRGWYGRGKGAIIELKIDDRKHSFVKFDLHDEKVKQKLNSYLSRLRSYLKKPSRKKSKDAKGYKNRR